MQKPLAYPGLRVLQVGNRWFTSLSQNDTSLLFRLKNIVHYQRTSESKPQLSRKPDLRPADVSRKRTSPSSGKGRSPRNPACTGLVLQSRTLSLILWSLPLVALSAFYPSVPPLLQGLSKIFSIYAPTLGASEDIKDHFYDELDSLIGKIPKVEPLILLGDFNARVGSDHQSWPSCIGHHGTGRMNDNGQRLLELCSFHGL